MKILRTRRISIKYSSLDVNVIPKQYETIPPKKRKIFFKTIFLNYAYELRYPHLMICFQISIRPNRSIESKEISIRSLGLDIKITLAINTIFTKIMFLTTFRYNYSS